MPHPALTPSRTAVITGGASGIGLATAERLAASGLNVCIADRDEEALGLAQRYPNAYLEISSQGLANVRRMVEEAPPDRVLFGSDWPFYHQAPSIAKALLATEGEPGLRRALLWENAARLFGLEAS